MSTESIQATVASLTAKDFATDQEVRWCPGCGDYSILAQVQKVMPTIGVPKENSTENVNWPQSISLGISDQATKETTKAISFLSRRRKSPVVASLNSSS
jgi:pyruvate/2-oxoacid:ferredoxin oxidoreductase beta subunit